MVNYNGQRWLSRGLPVGSGVLVVDYELNESVAIGVLVSLVPDSNREEINVVD